MDAPPSTILVVDDLEPNLRLVRALLAGAGYQVATASSGAAGLAAAARAAPDLILLDIMMPDLTGFEVCQRLRADPATRDIPIVFLTALHEQEDHLHAVALGGDEVLTKPINKLELLLRVKALLHGRALARTVAAQRQLIHALLAAYVSPAAAARFLALPAVPSLAELQAPP
jgi:two-component system sensor histidine kinase/response regulator